MDLQASQGMNKPKKYGDECELAAFHAEVEKQKSLRNVSRGNAKPGQRSSEAEAMQQAEGKSHNPGLAIRQPFFSPMTASTGVGAT